MKIVESMGNCHYEITGAREAEAAAALEEGLTAVSKRRNAYVDGNLDVILDDIRQDYCVEIRFVAH